MVYPTPLGPTSAARAPGFAKVSHTHVRISGRLTKCGFRANGVVWNGFFGRMTSSAHYVNSRQSKLSSSSILDIVVSPGYFRLRSSMMGATWRKDQGPEKYGRLRWKMLSWRTRALIGQHKSFSGQRLSQLYHDCQHIWDIVVSKTTLFIFRRSQFHTVDLKTNCWKTSYHMLVRQWRLVRVNYTWTKHILGSWLIDRPEKSGL